MARKRRIDSGGLAKAWAWGSGALAVGGWGLIYLVGDRPDFEIYTNWAIFAGIAPAFPVAIQSMADVASIVGLPRTMKTVQRSIESIPVISQIGRRDLIVTRNTKPIPGMPGRGTKTVNADDWLAEGDHRWQIFLRGRLIPIERKAPEVISLTLVEAFVKMAWDRQGDPATKRAALSRPYFVDRAGLVSFSEYYAIIGLLVEGGILWGRGETESGYLTTNPSRAMTRLLNQCPPDRIIWV